MKTYPLNQTQMGIYVAEQQSEELLNYNVCYIYDLGTEVNLERLAKALLKVLEVHPYVCSRLLLTEDGEVRIAPDNVPQDSSQIFKEFKNEEDMYNEMRRRFNLLEEKLWRFGYCYIEGRLKFGWSVHHLVLDGSTVFAFRNELNKAYKGEQLKGEKISSYDFAQMEQDERASSKLDEAREWYNKEFGAITECDSLPLPNVYDKIVTAESLKVINIPFTVTPEQMNAFAHSFHVGVSIPFLTAFGYTLATYSGDEEAAFGTIYHGRNNPDLKDTFGMYVKTLPVYVNFKDNPLIKDTLIRVREQNRTAKDLSLYSYADFCHDFNTNLKVCMAFHGNLFSTHLVIDDKVYIQRDIRTATPGYDIVINLYEDVNSTFRCDVQYSDAQYTEEFVRDFIKTFDNILKGMLCNESFADIGLVDSEQEAVLDRFNRSIELKYPEHNLVSLFRQTAATYPNNTALVFKDKRYTYSELDLATDCIAAVIASKVAGRCAKGVGVPVVSILIGRSEFMTISPLAVLKANAAYQPLDPSYPQERLNFMVKDSDACLLIAQRELRPLLSEYNGEVIYTDEFANFALDGTLLAPQCTIKPTDTFVLLYTSGSTGVPKGVMLTHLNMVTMCGTHQDLMRFTTKSVMAAYPSFGFDAHTLDIYPPLTCGAAEVIVPEEIRLDLDALNEFFAQNSVTHVTLTTQVGYQFATTFPDHPTLKTLLVGGEKLASLTPPKYTLMNGYGPSECTVYATNKPVLENETNIPIGHSNLTSPCKVMSRYGKRLPVGACGELVVFGPQVGKGYLNRPEKTAEVFGFYGEDSYRTGDIVRYRQNGDLEFVGRKDGQVKVRGFRIELKEVEAVVREFPDIKDATVQAFDLESGGKFIAAYIVSDKQIDINCLNGFIAERKPPYMVPAVTMQIDTIPLNVNQKVDKKKLPKLEVKSGGKGLDVNSAPRELNMAEKQLVEMVSKLVGSEVDVATPLVYCGLSSILSMRLAAQLHKRYGIRMSSKELLGGATIITIEDVIWQKMLEDGQGAGSVGAVNSQNEPSKNEPKEMGLSFAQQGVYLDCQANPDSTIYNIPMLLRLPLSVTAVEVQSAVRRVLASHPVLFVHFGENQEGESVQVLDSSRDVEIPIKVLSGETEASVAEALEAEKVSFVRPFNLKSDRLVRATILQLPSQIILLLDIHHLVSDGGSMDIITREILDVLSGKDVQNETYTYFDFCSDQKRFAQSESFAEHKQFFAEQLNEYEAVTEIAPDTKSSAPAKIKEVAVNIDDIQRTISSVNVSAGNDSLVPGITPAKFWLSALTYTAGRFTYNNDVYISTISSGRQNMSIAETVGMFVNTLPVSAHIKNQSTREYIAQVADMFAATLEHENYPFAGIAADYGYSATITYGYQLGIIDKLSVKGVEVTMESLELNSPKVKMAVFIDMYEGKPSIVIQYDDSLYSNGLMKSFAQSMASAAKNMLANLDSPISSISLLDKATLADICMVGMGERMEFDFSLTIPKLLRRQAAVNPDNVAVVFHDKSITYREYDHITDCMALYLTSLGVKRETIVGLMIERSELLALLPMAVMKAGGAYMPLDPEFPEDRLMFMCEDAGVGLILGTDGLVKEKLPNYGGTVVEAHQLFQFVEGCEGSVAIDKLQGPEPSSLMVVLYTSGSTGKPKGVLLEQRCIVNFSHWYAKEVDMRPTDKCSAFFNLGFDPHMLDLYPPLLVGSAVHIFDAHTRLDLMAMSEYINKYELTLSCITTQIGCQLVNMFKMPSLRIFSVGGEKMPGIDVPDYKFINFYGPTECSVASTFHYVTDSADDGRNIGHPLGNYQLYVIDSNLNILPKGAYGELVVSGRPVARGYLNRPDVNEAKFIKDPVNHTTTAYRTGDEVRWSAEGEIEFVGRIDGQVKLRGLRIELGEVENVMGKFPAIRQCVAAVKDTAGAQHLCGYFVPREGMSVNEEELRDFMHQGLTDFMVPDFFVSMEALPYTPNGKVDKKRLPVPEANEKSDYVAPRNQLERFFCDVVAQTLKLERVGIKDNFFRIGGTSIIAMRLSVAISKGGYNIAYKDLFDCPTPEQMAVFVSGNGAEDVQEGSEQHFDNEVEDYDYSRLEGVVTRNVISTFTEDRKLQSFGSVFLTGATGYLGVHVLHELLEDSSVERIYCIVRGSKKVSALTRLRTLLFYYFEKSYKEEDGKRLFVFEGDVTKPFDFFNEHIDTVINCAANVKHFSSGTDIEDINIGGTDNCIALCLRMGARLIHTSTGSICGMNLTTEKDAMPHEMLENGFYFGQNLENKYIHSKFMAERHVLEAVAEKGLRAKIMRLGNLGPRGADGEFQINFHSNAFMGRIKSFQTLGAIPYNAMVSLTEFSPIDDTARAICRLALTNDNCTIFHVMNAHRSLFMDVINCMNKIGCTINAVDNGEFGAILQEALKDQSKMDILQSMLAYTGRSDGKSVVMNSYSSNYTTEVLLHLGFQWNMTTWDYMEQFMLKIQMLGFFDEDYQR